MLYQGRAPAKHRREKCEGAYRGQEKRRCLPGYGLQQRPNGATMRYMTIRRCLLASCLALTFAGGCGGGSGDDDAVPCVAGSYPLGCVGDGRPESPTTPASLPTARCARTAYTMFKVDMRTSGPSTNIDRCQLEILDASGNLVEEYALPGGTNPSSGNAYGCSPGQTPIALGTLSYSSCCAGKGPLTFKLVATSSDDTVVQEGTGSGDCSPFPPEVTVLIQARLYN